MDKRFFANFGDSVKKTMQSRDMKELEQNLNQTVNEAVHSVKSALNQVTVELNRSTEVNRKDWNYAAPPEPRSFTTTAAVRGTKRRRPARGNTLGTTLTIAGGILIAGSSLALVFGGFHFLLQSAFSSLLHLAAVALPVLGVSVLAANVGSKLQARYRRCETYLRLTGDADFVTIKQLASGTRQTADYVANDLNRMIRKKMLPYA